MNTLDKQLEEKNVLTVTNSYNVEQKQALDRLRENPDFQRVILDGYFVHRAVDAVSMLAHDQTLREGTRPQLMETLIGISRLEDYFRVIDALGTVIEYADDEDVPEME